MSCVCFRQPGRWPVSWRLRMRCDFASIWEASRWICSASYHTRPDSRRRFCATDIGKKVMSDDTGYVSSSCHCSTVWSAAVFSAAQPGEQRARERGSATSAQRRRSHMRGHILICQKSINRIICQRGVRCPGWVSLSDTQQVEPSHAQQLSWS